MIPKVTAIPLGHASQVILVGLWVWISLGLIGTLWIRGRHDGLIKRLLWSVILCLPILGWVLYFAAYDPPKARDGLQTRIQSYHSN